MTTATAPEINWDPYDFAIDADPYPVWKQLRDHRPLYRNERYDFYAVSRFDDVDGCSSDWRTFSNARGSVLEVIKSGTDIPPGIVLFEDPPLHDLHRNLLARVFRPRSIIELEPKIRGFCARSLDPLVGSGGFDFITDLGAQMPMRTIGLLLGIPEEDQEEIRDQIDATLRLATDGQPNVINPGLLMSERVKVFERYVNWRVEHPSDDLMTELVQAEFVDETGTTRRLTRTELISYINQIATAGNETTTRLIGWAGTVLADHPEQRRELAENPGLIPNAVEELLRFESPSPVQARFVTRDVELHGQTVPAGSALVLLTGSANRDERRWPDAERFDIHRRIDRHVAFGYGLHFCMGAALARLEGRVALEEVLKRFPSWDIDWDNASRARTSTVRGWERLPVRVP
jgi:cytochrome P450